MSQMVVFAGQVFGCRFPQGGGKCRATHCAPVIAGADSFTDVFECGTRLANCCRVSGATRGEIDAI